MTSRDEELKKNRDLFEDFVDNEYFEALEDKEALKKKELSKEKYIRNKYVRRTRTNLSGGGT